MGWLLDRGGGSEDRTSLRGVAVNPWPRWLCLQGGGGGRGLHPEVCLVQRHMMAGRGGGEVSNLVFVCEAFSPPPPSFLWVWEAGQCQREVTYFMSHLKGGDGLPTKGRQGDVESWWMPWHTVTCLFTRCRSLVLTTINGSFPLPSDTLTMLCPCVLLHLKVLGRLEEWEAPLKGHREPVHHHTKTIHARDGRKMTGASTDEAHRETASHKVTQSPAWWRFL